MRCGLIQTWEQLRFCLQSIEDGMLDIDFSEPEEGSNPQSGSASSNGAINTKSYRKRSTDSTNAVDESELQKLSPEKSLPTTTGAPPKRPKANC